LSQFRVTLGNFDGPFDLLLSLINQRELDVTEVALATVTDEFIAYTKTLADEGSGALEQTTEFLVVAATLLDLKAARLLPAGEVESAEDLALLEARDLLFARLLQYRAYKQAAGLMAQLEAAALQRYPRSVSLEEQFLRLAPEVDLGVGPAEFARVAAAALAVKAPPVVGTAHIHAPVVSVREQAEFVVAQLKAAAGAWLSFARLVSGCEPLLIVGRFMALLELYRARSVQFDQPEPLGELRIRWEKDKAPS
jgi:segregation and condensation protein A